MCMPCSECKGKVTELTLQYNGDQSGRIRVVQKKDKQEVFCDFVEPDDQFTFNGVDDKGTLGTEILIYVCEDCGLVDDDDGHKGKKKKKQGKNGAPEGCTLLTKIHTSCSQPIGPGMVFGTFEVIEGYSREGGLLCPEEPSDDCGCDGKVTVLTFEYLGSDDAFIEVEQKKVNEAIFAEVVSPGGSFTVTGQDDKRTLGTEISIYIDGNLTRLHTSCSQPIGTEMTIADGLLVIVEGYSLKGGALCPSDPGDDDDDDKKRKKKKKKSKKARKHDDDDD